MRLWQLTILSFSFRNLRSASKTHRAESIWCSWVVPFLQTSWKTKTTSGWPDKNTKRRVFVCWRNLVWLFDKLTPELVRITPLVLSFLLYCQSLNSFNSGTWKSPLCALWLERSGFILVSRGSFVKFLLMWVNLFNSTTSLQTRWEGKGSVCCFVSSK